MKRLVIYLLNGDFDQKVIIFTRDLTIKGSISKRVIFGQTRSLTQV